MTNTVKRHSPPGAKRCAFTGYPPQKMPFGFNESDPRCIDFKRRVKDTIQALYDMGYRHCWWTTPTCCSPPSTASPAARP